MRGDWEGISGNWIDDPTAIDGRRFVISRSAVSEMRERMCKVAKNKCEFCLERAYSGERHHVYGRGIGSGKREDRPIVCGVRFVLWCCRSCHEEQIIKPWGSWSLQPSAFSGMSPARGRVFRGMTSGKGASDVLPGGCNHYLLDITVTSSYHRRDDGYQGRGQREN